ncbi:hypothetical protein D9758_011814 [Tetrapyrgos nigripes]|uniref:Uncharacterized protein n=1 Tax=Tetrapyrgos nigripes TaxID=182062 RepID=A0A8H5CMM7_9AGAR|nr:hypothetical protein D9758_011814 [Tetrapyrgos nigripes]
MSRQWNGAAGIDLDGNTVTHDTRTAAVDNTPSTQRKQEPSPGAHDKVTVLTKAPRGLMNDEKSEKSKPSHDSNTSSDVRTRTRVILKGVRKAQEYRPCQ